MRETWKVHFVFTKRIVQQSRNVLSFLFIERHCQRRVNVRFIASNSVPPSSLFLPKLWKIADGYIFINFIFSENLESYIYKKKKKKKKTEKRGLFPIVSSFVERFRRIEETFEFQNVRRWFAIYQIYNLTPPSLPFLLKIVENVETYIYPKKRKVQFARRAENLAI